MLGDSAIDGGLFGLHAGADVFYICSQQPADYTSASSTFALGSYNGGPGNILTSPMPAQGGRKVSLIPIAGGSTISGGTATYWAIVDSANLHLLATGPALPSQIVPPGAVWQFSTFDIGFLAGQLQGIDLVLASPVLGQPAMGIGGSGAVSLVVGSPTLGQPVATNTWALAASGITVASPVLGTPASLSTEALTAVNLVPASPIFGQPTLFGGVTSLTAIELDVQPPVFGQPLAFAFWSAAALVASASALSAGTVGRLAAISTVPGAGTVLARATARLLASARLSPAGLLTSNSDFVAPTVPSGLTAREVQVYNVSALLAGGGGVRADGTRTGGDLIAPSVPTGLTAIEIGAVSSLTANNFVDSSPKLDAKPNITSH